ncbi:hypothetical protein BDR26DRAFT_857168 [Obelidium mucronatum]|nr:hypothetical protein BDR26DRAFT_857168 [Obelidium mucronatum]
MDALQGSCLVLPLVSEACLSSIIPLQPEWTDNVVKEWQQALLFQREGKVDVIPIMVGNNEITPAGAKVYRKFEGFGMIGKMPNFRVPNAPDEFSVKEVVSNMFKLQGIFLNPLELQDKLPVIQARLSNEVWRKYRGQWSNQLELGPEPKFNCVQCDQEYSETTNGEGSCRFHPQTGSKCCKKGSKEGCTRGRHSNKHHNNFKYANWYEWRYNIFQYTTTQTANGEEIVTVTIGSTQKAAGLYSNGLLVSAVVSDNNWFQVFSKQDVASADIRFSYWARVSWVIGENNDITAIKLECGAGGSETPSSSGVLHFEWPVPDFNNGPIAKKLETHYNFPEDVLVSGQPINPLIPRKRDDDLPRWSGPNSSLRMKVKQTDARHDAYRKKDFLTTEVTIMNASKDPVMVVEGRVYARLRTTKETPLRVPETGQGDEDGDQLILTSEWKRLETVFLSVGRDGGVPLTISGSSSSELNVAVTLPASRYYVPNAPSPDNQSYSWIVYRAGCPVVLDIELEDIHGNVFGGMVEYCLPNINYTDSTAGAVFSMYCSDLNSANYSLLQVELAKKSVHDYCDPIVSRDRESSVNVSVRNFLYGNFDPHYLRYIFLQAEKQQTPSTTPTSSLGSLKFQWHVHAIVDFTRKSVAVSFAMTTVGYFPVPVYGDALTSSTSPKTIEDFSSNEWRREERNMTEKIPVGQRVSFDSKNSHGSSAIDQPHKSNGGGAVSIDVIEAAVPDLVKRVEAVVEKTTCSVRIQELERERDVLRDCCATKPSSSSS